MFAQVGYAGTVIPVVEETPASLMINARRFLAFFTLERKKNWHYGKTQTNRTVGNVQVLHPTPTA